MIYYMTQENNQRKGWTNTLNADKKIIAHQWSLVLTVASVLWDIAMIWNLYKNSINTVLEIVVFS